MIDLKIKRTCLVPVEENEAQGYHSLGRFAQLSQRRPSKRKSGQRFGLQPSLRPYIPTTPRNLLSLVGGSYGTRSICSEH